MVENKSKNPNLVVNKVVNQVAGGNSEVQEILTKALNGKMSSPNLATDRLYKDLDDAFRTN